MKTKKAILTAIATFALALVCGTCCQAGERNLDLSQKILRGNAIVQTWGFPNDIDACRTPSILGLCGSNSESWTTHAKARYNAKGTFGWHNIKKLNMNLTRVSIKKAAPNKLFQLVSMFIDDVQIATIGNFKIKFFISIE